MITTPHQSFAALRELDWTDTGAILKGGQRVYDAITGEDGLLHRRYLHRIFGTDTDFGEHTDPRTLKPIVERWENPGSSYALDHRTVHTVQAEADTISILVRGPATSDRFLILDVETGRTFWVYGAAQETPDQRAAKRMKPGQLATTIAEVHHLIDLTGKEQP